MRRFRPLISTVVLRTARQWGKPNPSLLDDLIQDTFLKLCADDCRMLRNFHAQHEAAFFGFLKVVTANVVRDHFKAAYAAKRGAGENLTSLEKQENSEERTSDSSENNWAAVEQMVLFEEIDRCLVRGVTRGELARSRQIFWLYYRCGLSARAIAALPHIELTTKGVESTILRLNRLVRAALAPPDREKAWKSNEAKLGKEGLRQAGSL